MKSGTDLDLGEWICTDKNGVTRMPEISLDGCISVLLHRALVINAAVYTYILNLVPILYS